VCGRKMTCGEAWNRTREKSKGGKSEKTTTDYKGKEIQFGLMVLNADAELGMDWGGKRRKVFRGLGKRQTLGGVLRQGKG